MLAPGDRAPQELKGLSKQRPTLVMLFKISCPVCQMAAPYVERLSQSDKIDVVGISQDDDEGTAEFCEAFNATFPMLFDDAGDGYPISNAFGIANVPSMFLIEPDARISLAVSGFSRRDLEAVGERAGVRTFLQGENVPEWKAG